jgi:hypothetical protein
LPGGGGVGGVMHCAWCLPVYSADACKQLRSQLEERNGAAWHREAFHGLGVQDVTKFDSD